MKRNDWKIVFAALLFTLLFYKQDAGLNYLAFSIVAVVLLALQNLENFKKPAWLAVAISAISSGFFVMKFGTPLPIIANIVSLIFLGGISFQPNSSLMVAGLQSLYSTFTSIPYMIVDFVSRKKEETAPKQKTNWLSKIALLFFPLIVVIVFFFLYRGANPLFLEFTKNINLDWISFPLLRFLILAFVLMYGFFIQRTLAFLKKRDDEASDQLAIINEEAHLTTFIGKRLSIPNEVYVGTALLLMLNVLIGLVNGLDIAYLWGNMALPDGEIFSDYLHTGTMMLIVSIVLAIGIILFFFRGYLNFYKNNKFLKILGVVWILQNILMIVSTAMRNQMYIDAYSLTHKRLGVYFYLLLAVVGLVFTFFKILQRKNNLFLFRKNAWGFYAVLVIASFFNWDNIITEYNIDHSQRQDIVALDMGYLERLSHVNTARLVEVDSVQDYSWVYFGGSGNTYYGEPIQEKILEILNYKQKEQWQSYCFSKEKNYAELMALNADGQIKTLDLNYAKYDSLSQFKELSNLEAINIGYSYDAEELQLKQLAHFTQLKSLNISDTYISDISEMPALQQLTHLKLTGNNITDYSALGKLPNLEYLNIQDSYYDNQPDAEYFPRLTNLKSINISNNEWTDLSFMRGMESLEELIFVANNQTKYIQEIPIFPSLTTVDISDNAIWKDSHKFLVGLSKSPNISTLNFSYNSLSYFEYLIDTDSLGKEYALFPNVRDLDVSYCNLQRIKGIELYKNIEVLNFYSNDLDKIEKLNQLPQLRELNLSYNSNIDDWETLNELSSLKTLNLTYNSLGNLDFFADSSSIKWLNLSNNNIYEIDSLSNLKNLEHLNISYNDIEDFSPLKNLGNLKYLDVSYNYTNDWSSIIKLQQLEVLNIGYADDETIEMLEEAMPNTTINYYEDAYTEESYY